MILRNVLKIIFGLLILFAVDVGLTSISHPIILKWVTLSAKHHGKPIRATIYTNGQINDHIQVFYSDEPNSYLLSLVEYDSTGVLKVLNINLKQNWIGKSSGSSKIDYDLIAGHISKPNK